MKKFTNKFVWAFAMMFGLFAINSYAGGVIINEILVNPNGSDSNCEYVELLSGPNTTLTNVYFASIEGDSTSTVGAFDRVVDLSASSTGSNGFLVITNDAAGDCTRDYNVPMTTRVQVNNFSMENGTTSWALILSPTTALVEGTDYDSNNDGTLDALPADATILDGLGFNDGGGADVAYGAILLPTAGGGADMATRFPGDLTPSNVSSWYYGDMDGANTSVMYDAGQVSDNFPTGGMLTPGAENVGSASAPGTARGDFDGDGRTDVSVFRGSEGIWYVNGSDAGFVAITFGLGTDTLIPGDYDGDGRADTAVFRPTATPGESDFYILNSFDSTLSGAEWGTDGDIPVVGDFTGDDRDDITVWRPSNGTFYSVDISNGTATIEPFGQMGDMPMALDNDGDGSANFAVFRPSENTWYVARPTGTPSTNFDAYPFGAAGDIPAPADYNGDSQDDIAMFRPSNGTWYVLDSASLMTSVTQFGTAGDIPVPGDYDGDGSDDQAIFRDGTWWVNGTTDGVLTQPFGFASDSPVPNAYLPQ